MRAATVIAITFVALAGCQSYEPPATFTGEREGETARSYDEVWRDLTAWFANNNVPIKNLDKDSGLIATDYVASRGGEFVNCGTMSTYQRMQQVTISLNVLLRNVDSGGSHVRANVFANAQIANVNPIDGRMISFDTLRCESNGSLEESILQVAGVTG